MSVKNSLKQFFVVLSVTFLSCSISETKKSSTIVIGSELATEVVIAQGRIGVQKKHPLHFLQNGTVKKIDVNDGMIVMKGDTLLSLDKQNVLLVLKEKKAALDEEKLRLEKLKTVHSVIAEQQLIKAKLHERLLGKKVNEAREMMKQGVIANKDFEQLKKDYTEANSDRIIAEAHYNSATITEQKIQKIAIQKATYAYQEAKSAYSHTILTAPSNGIVFSILVSEGELVTSEKPVIIFYPEEPPSIISAEVSEGDISKLQVGQKAQITFKGQLNYTGSASVYSFVPGTSELSQKNTVFVKVDSVDLKPYTGKTFTTSIFIDTVVAPIIEKKYLQRKNSELYVSVKNGLLVKKRHVHCSPSNNGQCIIFDGIAVGDTIVLPKYWR